MHAISGRRSEGCENLDYLPSQQRYINLTLGEKHSAKVMNTRILCRELEHLQPLRRLRRHRAERFTTDSYSGCG